MASIGYNNGKAWITPPNTTVNIYGAELKIPNYQDKHYLRAQKILRRGNIICRKPYQLTGVSGRNFVNLKNSVWDCSSSVSAILYGTYYHQTSSSVTGWWYNWGHTKKVNKHRSLVVYTYGQSGGAAHMFMDLWWLGHRITWDNCGSRRSSGHSMWWPGGKNPSRGVYPYKKRVVIF